MRAKELALRILSTVGGNFDARSVSIDTSNCVGHGSWSLEENEYNRYGHGTIFGGSIFDIFILICYSILQLDVMGGSVQHS